MRTMFLISAIALTLFAHLAAAQVATAPVPDAARGLLTEDQQKLRPPEEIEQNLKTMGPEKRKSLDEMCSDGKPAGTRTHALVELCAWIGQHR